jgi:hypothetical protein
MPATGYTLSAATTSIGPSRVFIGDALTVGGLIALPHEGAITESAPQNVNSAKYPELTGEIDHSAVITPGEVTVTVPVIYTGAAQMATLSAHGAASEGYSSPRTPTFTTLVIMPWADLDTTADPPTFGYNGTVWTPQAPVNARWYWKVIPMRPDMSSAFENNGKTILPVPFRAFYDSTKPSGHRVFTVGNPVTAGVTAVRV